MLNEQTYQRTVAIFLVTLILSLPLYSAQSLASVDIVRNSGQSDIDGFVDGSGDKWEVDVIVDTGEDVLPEDVTVNTFEFDTCDPTVDGFLCHYEFDFTDGVVADGIFDVDVEVVTSTGIETAESSISVDGAKPHISDISIEQIERDLSVTFTVQEFPVSCVGLEKIEILHHDVNRVLQTIDTGIDGCDVQTFDETVSISASESGEQTIAIRAVDLLGHEEVVLTSVFFDAVVPDVLEDTLLVGDRIEFVEGGIVRDSISVEVEEDLDTLTATLSTNQNVADVVGTCTITSNDEAQVNTFLCEWPNIEIDLDDSLTVTIDVSDDFNSRTETITKSFTVDTSTPVLLFFGTEFTSGEIVSDANDPVTNTHLVHTGLNDFVVRVTESESGVEPENILVDFSDINSLYVGQRREADVCESQGNVVECRWNDIDVAREGRIFLLQLEDNVGNSVDVSDVFIDAIIDDDAPVVNTEQILVVAIGQNGVRDFFQSRDALRISFSISEANGISLVEGNFSEVVDGLGVVEIECSEHDEISGRLDCEITTPRIISGPATVNLPIRIVDFAGNEVVYDIEFDILSTTNENDPEFWSRQTVTCSPNGLDVNTLRLAQQRVFCTVEFSSRAQQIELLNTELVECESSAANLDRAFMINNFRGSTSPTIVLEFSAVDEAAGELEFACELNLFTRRGTNAIQTPEVEDVNVTVNFFESQFDNDLRTIEDQIDRAKDKASSGFFEVIGVLQDIIEIAQLICNLLKTLTTIVRGAIEVYEVATDAMKAFPPLEGARVTACVGAEVTKDATVYTSVEYLDYFCKLVSCETSLLDEAEVLDGWTDMVNGGLTQYAFDAEVVDALGARPNPQESLVMSTLTLCIPGIVYNLDKLRQIECRYAACLENEVQSGVATVESCRELQDYQQCKYIYGELFQVVNWIVPLDSMFNRIKQLLTDPVGVLRLAVVLGCKASCTASGGATAGCSFVGYLFAVLDIVQDTLAIAEGFEQIDADYCSQVGIG